MAERAKLYHLTPDEWAEAAELGVKLRLVEDSARAFWRRVGERHGFQPHTVAPVPGCPAAITAVPTAVRESRCGGCGGILVTTLCAECAEAASEPSEEGGHG